MTPVPDTLCDDVPTITEATSTDPGDAEPQANPGNAEPPASTAAMEARQRDVAEGASDWIWETDTEQRLTFLSRRFGETSGIAWSQVNGRPLFDLVGMGFDRTGMEEIRAKTVARGAFEDVFRVDVAADSERFWRLAGKPYFDAATGGFAGYRGTGTDVTAAIGREAAMKAAVLRAEAAERAALGARRMLVDAIEAIQEGFVLHDADDRLVLCNKRYGEIYGLTSDQMTPGALFEDTLRETFTSITYAPAGLSTEAWVAERMRQHRSPDGSYIQQQLIDGRWMLIEERRTSDGGTVGIRVDVTEARRQEALEREHVRTNAELQAARAMQMGLLPSKRLQNEIMAKTGLDIASRSASCSELGGDLWGLSDLDRGRIGVFALDVAGHGTAAALNTIRLHTLIHELGAWLLEPNRFLQELNMRLTELLQPGAFATMFYGIVDPGWNCITYAAAGSPSPVIRGARDMPLTSLHSSGVPLGITGAAEYPCSKAKFGPGGMLFLYSDILIDCADANGNRAGEDGAFAMIQRCADEPTAEAIVERVCAPFLSPPGKSLSDDLTAVCIMRP